MPWNWGQVWGLRSDFVDSTRGHEVPDVEERQLLRAGDMNGVGVTDLYCAGNSSVATPTFQAHVWFGVGICFPFLQESQTKAETWSCPVCHLPPQPSVENGECVPHARGHYTLRSMKMLLWVPPLRAGILALGRRSSLEG